MSFLVDSHCHLASLSYAGKGGSCPGEILKRAERCGVTHCLSVSCTVGEFEKNRKLCADFDNVYLSCGVHPLNLDECPHWSDEELLGCLQSDKKVLCVGETGLDYHYAPESRSEQIKSFARQIGIANQLKLPIMVHAREAAADCIEILKAENARDCSGVIHCFTDTVDFARKCLDLGFYISFTGISTFKGSDNVREVIKYVPNDRIMVETDSPYLSPIPVRGVECEPAFVRYTADFIAAFKGLSPLNFAKITSDNFQRLYHVKLSEPKSIDCQCSTWKLERIIDRKLDA